MDIDVLLQAADADPAAAWLADCLADWAASDARIAAIGAALVEGTIDGLVEGWTLPDAGDSDAE